MDGIDAVDLRVAMDRRSFAAGMTVMIVGLLMPAKARASDGGVIARFTIDGETTVGDYLRFFDFER